MLRTDRLLIRPARASDAAALSARRSDPEVARYQNWTLPFTLEQAEALLADAVAHPEPRNDDWFMFTLAAPDDTAIFGDLALHLTWDSRAAEIGYTLAREHWGNGYAVEAVEALIPYLFDTIGVTRIMGQLHPDNAASAMVLERNGFLWEGRTRLSYWVGDENSDDVLYGLTRDDWDTWRNRPRHHPETVELVEITPDNVRTVRSTETHRSQEAFVAPNVYSMADALTPEIYDDAPVVPWYRAIAADGEIAGFVMLAEITDAHPEPYLWRLMVGRLHQRRGIGTRALDLVVDVCRGWGATTLTTSWVEGRGSPRPVYETYGFEPTGNVIDGETEARLVLPADAARG